MYLSCWTMLANVATKGKKRLASTCTAHPYTVWNWIIKLSQQGAWG